MIIGYCGIDTRVCFRPAQRLMRALKPQIKHQSDCSLQRAWWIKKVLNTLFQPVKAWQDQGVDFSCTIAGDGPLLNELEYQIQQLHLGGRVTLTGRPILQEDIPKFYAPRGYLLSALCVGR